MEHRLLHRIPMKFFTRYVFALNLQSKTYRGGLERENLNRVYLNSF